MYALADNPSPKPGHINGVTRLIGYVHNKNEEYLYFSDVLRTVPPNTDVFLQRL